MRCESVFAGSEDRCHELVTPRQFSDIELVDTGLDSAPLAGFETTLDRVSVPPKTVVRRSGDPRGSGETSGSEARRGSGWYG